MVKNSMKDYEHIAKHKRIYFFKSINELPEGNWYSNQFAVPWDWEYKL